MGIEDYKKLIITLVEASKDLEYIIAIYSFADSYPDKSRDTAICPQKIALNS